jgi:3-hydroxyacyl-CoA dehydrogenase
MQVTTLSTGPAGGTARAAHRPFRSAAVLGAGVMGSQIAAHLANAGLEVLLLDVSPEEIGRDGRPNDIVDKSFSAASRLTPDPFMSEVAKRLITLGNFQDDFQRIGEVDWVIEVVVERLDVKRSVMARIEEHASQEAVISTNTSGLPIRDIAAGRGVSFRRRFLGTHFFNPPRYLKLFEVIPTEDTDPAVLDRVTEFARLHLGKGIVTAKDTPNFIGNRIGVYAMMEALREFTEGGFSVEEVDQLTGTLIGRPKSATFRTADVVGLDTLQHVAENLFEAIPDDESRDAFRVPEVLERLVEQGRLGQKTKAGFYKKEGGDILSIDPETMEYTPAPPSELDLSHVKGPLPARLVRLYEDDGRAGDFFRRTTLELLGYSTRRIPEIADSPADIDRAIVWGFGWEIGPFGIWDTLGIDRVRQDLRQASLEVPAWVDQIPTSGFYIQEEGIQQVWIPSEGRYIPDPQPSDEWGLNLIRKDENKLVWQNDEAALLDIGEGVALYEFRSKANSLGQAVMQGLAEVIDRVENDRDFRGLVIGNEGKNFSVGANLGEFAVALMMGKMDEIGGYLEQFQQSILAVRYSTKPVVVTTHQRVLGGACEMTLACPHPVAAAETYIGLVELGVGLIPAGCGTMMMAARAGELAANRDRPSEIQPFLRQHFEQIAMAKVATSAFMAQEMNLLPPEAVIVMNEARRFHVARHEVIRLSEQGYRPPPVRTRIPVLGAKGRAPFDVALYQFRDGKYISEYDMYLAQRLAWVMTGGDLTGPADVHENYLLELEREVFLSLLGEEKTRARIESILTTNKPLRN